MRNPKEEDIHPLAKALRKRMIDKKMANLYDPRKRWNAPDLGHRNYGSDIADMIENIKKMQREVAEKMKIINEREAKFPDQIKSILNNPNNFTQTEWDFLTKNKGLLNLPSFTTFNIHLQPRGDGKGETAPPSASPTETTPTNRKGKTLGARKKWIPMR